MWTPEETRDWFKLGYTYPELPTRKVDSAQLLKMVNDNYGMSRKEALMLANSANAVPGVEVLDDEKGVKTFDYALSIKYSKYDTLSVPKSSAVQYILIHDRLGLLWVAVPSTLRSSCDLKEKPRTLFELKTSSPTCSTSASALKMKMAWKYAAIAKKDKTRTYRRRPTFLSHHI